MCFREKAGSSNLCKSISLATAFGGQERQIATLNSFLKCNCRAELEQHDNGVITEENETYSDPLSVALLDNEQSSAIVPR